VDRLFQLIVVNLEEQNQNVNIAGFVVELLKRKTLVECVVEKIIHDNNGTSALICIAFCTFKT
jgi:hypothetical protein